VKGNPVVKGNDQLPVVVDKTQKKEKEKRFRQIPLGVSIE